MSFNLLPDDIKHKILWMSIHSELSEYVHIHSERISIGCLDHNNADEDYWRPPMWKKLEWYNGRLNTSSDVFYDSDDSSDSI